MVALISPGIYTLAQMGVRHTCGCPDENVLTPICVVWNGALQDSGDGAGAMMASMTQEQKIELIALNAQLGKMNAQGRQ